MGNVLYGFSEKIVTAHVQAKSKTAAAAPA
jgi:hypothetical protein